MRLKTSSIGGNWRRLLGCGLLIGELALLFGVWQSQRPTAPHSGFLTKVGGQFLVAWPDEQNQLKTALYDSLDEASRFIKYKLELKAARTLRTGYQLENLWEENRFGDTVLVWKTEALPFVNQMTFQNSADSHFFARAFRQGAYSASPYGHAILLVPIRTSRPAAG